MTNIGVCAGWCTVAGVKARPGNATLDDDVVADAIDVASDLLFRLAGHRWPGVCERTVRPTARPAGGEPSWWWQSASDLSSGSWVNFTAGLLDSWGTCGCNRRRLTGASSTPSVQLGAYPVLSVLTVMLDGQVLDPGEYRIDDDRWLTRVPVAGSRVNVGWPCCQRLDLPDTEVGTWSVQFTFGGAPPSSGQAAACALASELARMWDADFDGDCGLDPSVSSVTREGITIDVESVAEAGRAQGFGVPEVKMFLEAVNPSGMRRRARAVNPDRAVGTVRTAPTSPGGS